VLITGARIVIVGDPDVGIPDHEIMINHLDYDTSIIDPRSEAHCVDDLRGVLRAIGGIVGCQDDVRVFLEGWDDRKEKA
jgi:hypothetical protein